MPQWRSPAWRRQPQSSIVPAFIGDLVVKLVNDDKQGLWELVQPLSFQSDLLAGVITAPAGHKTDFCSVPRVPFVYDILGDRARKSGTIHDWLYTSHQVDRLTADCVLEEMLMVDGIGPAEARMFYLAVRIGGGTHW